MRKVGSLEVCIRKIRSRQAGMPQLCLAKGGRMKIGALQVRPFETGTGKVRTGELGFNQMCRVKVG